ncbi:Fic family protein [Nocardia sp. NPDC005978]|uniref:Fic family protein n=1 Tax=Nocardia sp. NPDC005978 TaxID=3156725 RepID=UPI00339FB3B3
MILIGIGFSAGSERDRLASSISTLLTDVVQYLTHLLSHKTAGKLEDEHRSAAHLVRDDLRETERADQLHGDDIRRHETVFTGPSGAGHAPPSSQTHPIHPSNPPVHPANDHLAGKGDEVALAIVAGTAELGLRTPGQRALEASLVIDRPLLEVAVIARQPSPELLFSKEEWAGYLAARTFTRKHTDTDLTVPFMTEVHQNISRFSKPGLGGEFVNQTDMRSCAQWTALTKQQVDVLQANPYVNYLPPGSVNTNFPHAIIEYRTISPENARTELQSLCEWYNSAKGEPGADPYRLAAELQQRFTSIHPWNDYNGRCSRLLMNWSLERHGMPPSAPNDFNNDLFSTPEQWTEEVRAGSELFRERSDRLARLGDAADPVTVFDLKEEHYLYTELGWPSAPFTPGAGHNISELRLDMDFLRGGPA